MNKGVNISEYLGFNPKPTDTSFKTNGNISPVKVVSSSIPRILAYVLAIIIVILVILLFINFFITPIFRLKPGAPGYIPVPGFDDGVLFWNKASAGQILNKDLPIASTTYNYSLNIDVFVQNPLQFSRHPRILLSRGAIFKPTPDGDTLLGLLDFYNIVVALLPDTNDLLVSVLNKDNNMENVVIPNIPVQEPFRLGVILMEKSLEVYINGQLIKTKTFSAPPRDVKGDIYPASGIEANIALLRNLKIWPRILSTSEIRYATPSLSTAKNFGAGPMPSSSTCSMPSSSSAVQQTAQTMMDRFNKLSVDTVSDINQRNI
jgi:hypothetical protein